MTNPVLLDMARAATAAGAKFSADDLVTAIESLESRQREAMTLFHVQGVTNKYEIARRMKISPPAVNGLLSRGLDNVLAILVNRAET